MTTARGSTGMGGGRPDLRAALGNGVDGFLELEQRAEGFFTQVND